MTASRLGRRSRRSRRPRRRVGQAAVGGLAGRCDRRQARHWTQRLPVPSPTAGSASIGHGSTSTRSSRRTTSASTASGSSRSSRCHPRLQPCGWTRSCRAANFSAESWLEGAGAVAAENQVIELLCRAAGMPTGSAGCFMSGGSIGNLSALAVGRDGAGGRRLVAVADTAHASVDNALHLLGLEPLVVPTGPDCRMTGDAVRTAIGDRRDVGIIVASGGSTNAGVIDDLCGCADVATEIGAWFHVDGAYGLATILLPELRDRFVGLERADSFIVDPHKWLFATAGSCALVYRNPALGPPGPHAARSVHRRAAYRRRCLQPVRSRVPVDPPRQRIADLVRPRPARRRCAPRCDPSRHPTRIGDGRRPRRRSAHRTDHATGTRCGAVPARRMGSRRVETVGDRI